jgi:hypothetical protein
VNEIYDPNHASHARLTQENIDGTTYVTGKFDLLKKEGASYYYNEQICRTYQVAKQDRSITKVILYKAKNDR